MLVRKARDGEIYAVKSVTIIADVPGRRNCQGILNITAQKRFPCLPDTRRYGFVLFLEYYKVRLQRRGPGSADQFENLEKPLSKFRPAPRSHVGVSTRYPAKLCGAGKSGQCVRKNLDLVFL